MNIISQILHWLPLPLYNEHYIMNIPLPLPFYSDIITIDITTTVIIISIILQYPRYGKCMNTNV